MRSETEIRELISALQNLHSDLRKDISVENAERIILKMFRIKGAIDFLEWVLNGNMPDDGYFALIRKKMIIEE